jgi:hypothetical protein
VENKKMTSDELEGNTLSVYAFIVAQTNPSAQEKSRGAQNSAAPASRFGICRSLKAWD